MYLNELMTEQHMTRADLRRISGVPDSTLRDILGGRTQLDHCEAGTLYLIADALDTTVEDILDHYLEEDSVDEAPETPPKRRTVHDSHTLLAFYTLTEAVYPVLATGFEIEFAQAVRKNRWIETLYAAGQYRQALYLLALIDYLDRLHGVPHDPKYDVYRCVTLDAPVYGLSTLQAYDDPNGLAQAQARAERHAILEFAAFNLFMTKEDVGCEA